MTHREEEFRRHQDRMASIGATLAGVAHELNNPLAAIFGFSQLLLKKSWPEEDRLALEAIRHEASRSATIVKDLLDLVRHRAGTCRSPTDLNEVVAYIVRTRRYSLETAGIVCALDLASALPLVHGDRSQLEQVVLNLVSNAEQALRMRADAPEHSCGGRLVIRTRSHDRQVVLEIEDNGPGIPPEERGDIWSPFWTSRMNGDGTGLGLVIVRDILADHGGVIELDAEAGDVTRFVVRLPVCAVDASESRAARPLDVLVVDPESTEMSFVERFLAARGHAVVNVKNADAAFQLASRTPFDRILVTDCAIDQAEHPLPLGAVRVTRPYDVEELRRVVERD